MVSASPFQEVKDGSKLRLEWNNRRVRKDNWTGCFFVVFGIVWISATLFVTILLLADVGPRWFFAIWLIFGWLGTLLIPYSLLGRFRREWIEISEAAVCHGRIGFFAQKPRCFPLATILCIGLGHCNDEMNVTLSVFLVPGSSGLVNRHLFGYWLAPNLKEELFEKLDAFVREQELPLQMNKGHAGAG